MSADLLRSRSIEECHLYMALHGCSCGDTAFEWSRHSLSERAGQLVSRYEGTCPGCGEERVFEFAIPAMQTSMARRPVYGDAEASRIIDPGEFLADAQRLALSVPRLPDQQDEEDLIDAYSAIELAVAAVTEVLKFVPEGADAVPAGAFTSAAGRRLYERDPGQFGRDRLELELADYERVQSAYEAVVGD
jgi:hypothetical protein